MTDGLTLIKMGTLMSWRCLYVMGLFSSMSVWFGVWVVLYYNSSGVLISAHQTPEFILLDPLCLQCFIF